VAANFLQTSGVKFDNGEATLLLQAADIADQAKLMSVSNVVDQGLFARSEVENGVARCEMPSSASPLLPRKQTLANILFRECGSV
jgi:hypothetical protein